MLANLSTLFSYPSKAWRGKRPDSQGHDWLRGGVPYPDGAFHVLTDQGVLHDEGEAQGLDTPARAWRLAGRNRSGRIQNGALRRLGDGAVAGALDLPGDVLRGDAEVELFVTQQALSRWEKGTADPSIDMIRLISTRFEVPMARLMEMPDNGFCQSCAMPFYRPEDHGTEPDGTRSGDYCNYCYDDGVFLQDYANSDELVAACAPMMAESCHISVEQAEDCMSALLPNLKRWRHQDEIDAVAEGE